MLTQDTLKEYLSYNTESGNFTWLKRTSNRIKVGEEAGSLGINGYISISILGKKYYAHRLAFLYISGSMPTDQVDHINHVRTDNSWNNLSQATNLSNGKNQKKNATNSTGLVGVSWSKQNKKWHAYISHKNKRIPLGHYSTKLAAAYARHQAEIMYGYHKNHGT